MKKSIDNIGLPTYSDEEILKFLLAWKAARRLTAEDVRDLLDIKRTVYYRRINQGGWKRAEIIRMVKIGIISPEQNTEAKSGSTL